MNGRISRRNGSLVPPEETIRNHKINNVILGNRRAHMQDEYSSKLWQKRAVNSVLQITIWSPSVGCQPSPPDGKAAVRKQSLFHRRYSIQISRDISISRRSLFLSDPTLQLRQRAGRLAGTGCSGPGAGSALARGACCTSGFPGRPTHTFQPCPAPYSRNPP